MASDRPVSQDWQPNSPIKISTRPVREPRDERVRIPRSAQRRPTPIVVNPYLNTTPAKKPPVYMETIDLDDSSHDPAFVNIVAPNTWPRKGMSLDRSGSRRKATPSLSSRYSYQQSEISFGILDYYMRDHTPLQSPDLVSPTTTIDPAIGQFDFDLSPKLTTPRLNGVLTVAGNSTPQAKAGAKAEQPLIELSPIEPTPPRSQPKATYNLFPTVKETPKVARLDDPQMPITTSPTGNANMPPHQQPDPSYRPRKQSVTSSIRSRRDSFTSFRCSANSRRIPLRILSGSSTASAKTMSTFSTQMNRDSPPGRSRWSEDTIISPTTATTPGPRTSFGSLLAERDNAQYPACFFEDDDESVPLRMKLGWKRSASLTQERPTRNARGRFDGMSWGRKMARVVLCGCC